MIYTLEIENFYSICERQVIDLRATDNVSRDAEYLAPIWRDADERGSRVIAIYGANGSGKSNVLRALAFLAWFARDSFQAGRQAYLPYQPFLTSTGHSHPTRLAIDFSGPLKPAEVGSMLHAECRYKYEVAMQLKNGEASEVIYESLHYWPGESGRKVRLFERIGDRSEIATGKAFNFVGYRLATEKVLRSNASVISTLAQLDHPFALALWNAAAAFYYNLLVVKHEDTDENITRHYALNPTLTERLNHEIERIDLGIREMKIEETTNGPRAMFRHTGLGTPLPIQLESHGTRMFIRAFPLLVQALETGGVAVIDELDAAIHPLVLPELVRWFRDSKRNPLNAQLWMSCQNPTLLETLEKEEILFCSKDVKGCTSVYGLADVKGVRRIDNYYRKYLSGVYGAVPQIG